MWCPVSQLTIQLWEQSWGVVTVTIWLTRPKIFIIWPFEERDCPSPICMGGILWAHTVPWAAEHSRAVAGYWPLGSWASFQLLVLPLHFSVWFSPRLQTKVVWTERAELSLLEVFLLISPQTAFYPCPWLPPSPLLFFPSLWPLTIYEWRRLDPFCNKPWVTPLNREVGFGNNVKNCEILSVCRAQPSFGQWIMALAKIFSLQSLLTSLEEWKLLPAKIGSSSASFSNGPASSLGGLICTFLLSLWATICLPEPLR